MLERDGYYDYVVLEHGNTIYSTDSLRGAIKEAKKVNGAIVMDYTTKKVVYPNPDEEDIIDPKEDLTEEVIGIVDGTNSSKKTTLADWIKRNVFKRNE